MTITITHSIKITIKSILITIILFIITITYYY